MPVPLCTEPLCYRVPDACQMLGIGRSTLYSLIKQERLTPIRLYGRTLIPRKELDALLVSAMSEMVRPAPGVSGAS